MQRGKVGLGNSTRTAATCDGPCEAGYYCPVGFCSATQNACPAGTFSATPDAASALACAACPPGSFSSSGAAACTPCAAGTFNAASQSAACATCPAGTYSAQGASSCESACPVGTFADGTASCVPCYPLTACTVAGLSAQPPCYWNVSTLAGNGSPAFADGVGTQASLNRPLGISYIPFLGGNAIADSDNFKVRLLSSSGRMTTLAHHSAKPCYIAANNRLSYVSMCLSTLSVRNALSGATGIFFAGAEIGGPNGMNFDNAMNLYVASWSASSISRFTPSANRSMFATIPGRPIGLSRWNASGFCFVSTDVFTGSLPFIYSVSTLGNVAILAGNGASTSVDGIGTSASFTSPRQLDLLDDRTLLVADQGGNKVRMVTVEGVVTTIAGNGSLCNEDGFLPSSCLAAPTGIAVQPDGSALVSVSHYIRKLTCVPCPASYYCFSGAPALCPAGSYCALSSVNATPCPAGTWSSATGAASNSTCAPCPTGTYGNATGATMCTPCPCPTLCALPGLTSAPSCCPPGSLTVSGSWGAATFASPNAMAQNFTLPPNCVELSATLVGGGGGGGGWARAVRAPRWRSLLRCHGVP